MRVSDSNSSSRVPKPAGKDDEPDRVLHEHDLPHEEVAELHAQVDVLVQALLEGQLDVGADGQAAALLRAAVRRLHDPRPAAREDREALFGQRRGQSTGRPVIAVAPADACGSEDADRRTDLRERIEALDELTHDAQRSPGIGLLEAGNGLPRAKELLVLRALVGPGLAAYHDGATTAVGLLLPTGHRYLSRSTLRGSNATVTTCRHDSCIAGSMPVDHVTG